MPPLVSFEPIDLEKAKLYIIVDRRYSDLKRTVITSNLTVAKIAEKVGDRIASRIAGMCKVIELRGKDRRLSG